MLKLKSLSRHYKTKKKVVAAVDQINLEFHKGEFVSILGLSGSGKTTLVSQIGGLDRPTAGKLFINDVDTTIFKSQDWADYRLNNIGFVFQDFNLINHLTAQENIEIALSLSGYTSSEKRERSTELLEMMGLSNRGDQLPSQLSGGEKQRVAIARALANHPDIILADEPTGALDPDTSVQIMEILKSLSEKGHLVIMVTHNKYLAQDYSSRIVELSDGKVIRESELKSHNEAATDPLEPKRSSLELGSAFKIAINNIKLRKKSTVFSLISLIPSMILIFALLNFIFNLVDYKDDFSPVIDDVVTNESTYFISPYTDDDLDSKVRFTYRHISARAYDEEMMDETINDVLTPYSKEELNEIKDIPGVKDILEPIMFNLVIDNKEFIAITLPPKKYATEQAAIQMDRYPEDEDQGIIMSSEAAKRLIGKYETQLSQIKGQDLDVNLWALNGLGMSYITFQSQDQIKKMEVLDVIEMAPKTTLVKNYYAGYIFLPYEYGLSLRNEFENDDFTMVAMTPPGPFAGTLDPIILGPLYMMDLLEPLREKTMLQDSYDLFSFREFSYMMASNNFSVKRKVLTDESFTESSLEKLATYGEVSKSAYDDTTYESSLTTKKYINYTLWGASGLAVIIILIPSLLVSIILYISILLRVKEIGVLKSLGARKKDIVMIFTIEAGVVAVIGTIVGMCLSIPVINLLQNVMDSQYKISFYLGSNPMSYNIFGLVIAGIGSLVLVTLFGLLPGRKASKLQPNVLLKHIN